MADAIKFMLGLLILLALIAGCLYVARVYLLPNWEALAPYLG